MLAYARITGSADTEPFPILPGITPEIKIVRDARSRPAHCHPVVYARGSEKPGSNIF